MKISSRLIKIAICLVMIMSLSACWDSRELNELGIVVGAGLDKDEGSGTIKFTAQVVKAGEIASIGKSGGSGGEKAYANFSNIGNTVFAAVRDITNESSRKLYFPHNQILILGRSAAEDGITKYLDFFMRDTETRLNVYVLVAEDSAEKLLDIDPQLEKVPAYDILHLVEGESKFTSQAMTVKLRDFKARLMSKTASPVAPLVEITDKNGKKIARINGVAVFKGDKLVGTLDKKESRGLSWVLGKVKSTIIETKSSQGNPVAMETVRASGNFSPELKDGKIKIKINIVEEGNVGEQTGPEDLSDIHEIVFLEAQKSEVIKSDVMAAFKKAQELNADIFGFGDAVQRKYPEEWTEIEDKWDELFSKIELEINADAELRLMGRTRTPSVPQ